MLAKDTVYQRKQLKEKPPQHADTSHLRQRKTLKRFGSFSVPQPDANKARTLVFCVLNGPEVDTQSSHLYQGVRHPRVSNRVLSPRIVYGSRQFFNIVYFAEGCVWDRMQEFIE